MHHDITADDIVRQAQTWIGVPFVEQGRSKEHGIDCLGLYVGVGLELGFKGELGEFIKHLAVEHRYTSSPKATEIRQACLKYLDPDILREFRPGDLAQIAIGSEANHIGIIGYGTLINCYGRRMPRGYPKHGRVEEVSLTPEIKSKVRYLYRIRGL